LKASERIWNVGRDWTVDKCSGDMFGKLRGVKSKEICSCPNDSLWSLPRHALDINNSLFLQFLRDFSFFTHVYVFSFDDTFAEVENFVRRDSDGYVGLRNWNWNFV
jgi:hypothetical protein